MWQLRKAVSQKKDETIHASSETRSKTNMSSYELQPNVEEDDHIATSRQLHFQLLHTNQEGFCIGLFIILSVKIGRNTFCFYLFFRID
jgi:hypothetical protein